MDHVDKQTTFPKGLTAIIVVLVLGLGVQSLFLYRLWRERPQRANTCGLVASQHPSGGSGHALAPRTHGRQWMRDPFGDLDDLWKNFDSGDWNPLEEFRHMRQEMDSLFDDSFGRLSLMPGAKGDAKTFAFSPDLDLQEKDGNYVARMDIPGADKNDLSVKLEDRVLTVSGQINTFSETKEDKHVFRKERRSGSFKRSITLPGAVVADKLDAHYDKGVLTITIPKAKEETQSKSVQVK